MAPGADPEGVRGLIGSATTVPADVAAAGRSTLSTLPWRTVWIGGPTASGKSAVALALAEALGGEIVSADSMQVFRGLDVGTAKPSAEERRRVRHHLLDCVDPSDPFDAARWLELAQTAFHDIRARGRVPIFCGGTGLYFSAWFRGLDAPAPSDPELRRELEARPIASLLEEIRQLSPETYDRIDRQNARRVVRALEILRVEGGPAESSRSSTAKPAADPTQPIFVLRRETENLRRRIDLRVDAMFAAGLVEEVRGLMENRGLGSDRTAMQAIGYRQVVEFLQGQRSLGETVALVKTRTRQLAKRQMTWFRHQLPVVWIDVEEGEEARDIVRRLLEFSAFQAGQHLGVPNIDPASLDQESGQSAT